MIVKIEKEIDSPYFHASFTRQENGKLYGHIQYKKWSPTAKKETLAVLNDMEEPIYAFIHNKKHAKYLNSLGFISTGGLVQSEYPGKEEIIFPEVVYLKENLEKFCVALYKQEAELLLPIQEIAGYNRLEELEEQLKKQTQVEWTTTHMFSKEMYIRETFVPAKTLLTGWRHKQESVNILSMGYISVIGVDKLGYATDYGMLKAPQTFISKKDIKKIGYAHEDTLFINVFSLTDFPPEKRSIEFLEDVENYLFEKGLSICQE